MQTVTADRIGQARARARELCATERVPDDRCGDLQIVLSELLGNACRHGSPPVGFELSAESGDLLVSVQDCDPAPPQVSGDPGLAAEGGRGLLLVQELSRRWGWRPTGQGKTVWARV